MSEESAPINSPTVNEIRKSQKSVVDELEFIKDEKEKFWKTPSATRLVRGGTMLVIFDIFGSIFFTIYMMIISRISPEESSLLAVIDTLGLMMKFFAYLGFTGAGSKFLSEYLARDKDTARIYAKECAKYNMWLTGYPLIAVGIYLLFSQPTSAIEEFAYWTLLIMIIFDRFSSSGNIYILGYQRYDLYAYCNYLPYAIQYILAIILYPIYGVIGPLFAFAFAHILIFILTLVMVKRCSDFPLTDLLPWGKNYGLFKKLFNFNFLYSLANLAFSLLTSTLLISGGELLHVLTKQEISTLYIISTFSNLLVNLFNIVGSIMVSISEASALKNKKLMENYTLLAMKFPIYMIIAVLTFYILFGKELIEILYGEHLVPMGMLIMICLMPSYTTSAFGSKYDNILAGMGRPETVIKPWMIALGIGIFSLLIGMILPADFYLVDNFQTIKGNVENYGISLRFTVCLVLISLALFVGGIWVVKICLKVLGVRLPREYITKPLFVAGITAGIVQLFLTFVPLRQIFNNAFNSTTIGGIVYTVIMVVVGIVIYLILSLLCDAMNREDGKFWKIVIDGFGPLKYLMKPLFDVARFLLNHQIKRFVSPPLPWVLKSDKATLQADSQFRVDIIPISEGISRSEKGVHLERDQLIRFKINIKDVKVPIYNLIAFARIDFDQIPETLQSTAALNTNQTLEYIVEFKVPTTLRSGSHELLVNLEAYESPRSDLSPQDLMNKGSWTYNDYRMRWLHEERYFIFIQ